MTRIEPKQFIELEDIQVNPEHWTQKISIIEFRDKKGKTYWTKDYNFIPKWKRYKEAKDWIKETNFPEYDCKIVWNDNNGIEIVTQNYFGTVVAHEQAITWIIRKIQQKVIKEINDKLDFNNVEDLEIKKDLEIILGFKTYEQFFNTYNNEQKLSDYNYLYEEHLEELKSAEREKGRLSGKDLEKQAYDLNRPDLAILWRKQLYFISGWKYIDNYKLSVQFTAFKCPLSISYPTWLTTQGIGTLEQGPVVKDYSDKPVLNKKGQRLLTGHRFHYDFCSDLGIKIIYENAFKSYQPEFTLLIAENKKGIHNISWGEDKGGKILIPTDITLQRADGRELDRVLQAKHSFKTLLSSLAPKKLFKGTVVGDLAQSLSAFRSFISIGPKEFRGITLDHWEYLDKEEILFENKPGITSMFIKQPHLLDHTTFQFYFFNKISMTANGRYLGIVEKDGKLILPYKLFISHAPGNLYYRWLFEYIWVKLEISTEAVFEDYGSPLRYMTGIRVEAATFGAGINWKQSEPQKSNHQGEGLVEQEGQTDRMFKSTFKDNLDKTTEPSTFNANTIDFHYSMGEFFNRLTDPIFFYRVDISELLYNNLSWANNKSTYLGLPFQWKELGSWAQNEGFYKWKNVYLESDYLGFWSNLMKKGYLLTNGEDMNKPELNYQRNFGYILAAFNPLTGVQAEEEVTEKQEKFQEEMMQSDITNAEYNNVDYIGSPDDNIWQELNRVNNNCHVGNSPFPNNCLGCLCGGGSHGNPNYNFERTYNFTSGGALHLKTKGSGEQRCEIPPEGGMVKFIARGNSAKISIEGERTTYESKMKESKRTAAQEIDQEQLETENFEIEQITVEQENAEEILKEIGDGQERETVEPEQETEKESEQEKEGETEKETETERENEKETEQEKERENESEQEKLERERLEREEAERKEQERKEREGEDENENE